MARKVLMCLTILMVLSVLPAFAQRDLGTLTGVVTDPTGAVVPNAKVAISEEATGQKYTVETDTSGTWVRPLLKPGTYVVEIEAAGFRKAVRREVLLTAGDRIGVNITLSVGDISQAVEVTAIAPLLQTESPIIGAQLSARVVSEVPLGGQRKFSFLARMSLGVLPSEPGARDEAGGGFSANGVRSNGQNNFLLNGVDNNVNVIDFINQTAYVIGPSLEAIGEMRVLTNGYNAEYGRGAGGVVNVTLKSGANELHGALFEFLQHDKLNANKWESNRAGTKKGPFKQNQFGAAVGGRIIKDRTFWFADYQGTRIRSTGGIVPGLGASWAVTIPKPEMKNGDFSDILGRVLGQDELGRSVAEGQIYDITTTRRLPSGAYIRDPFPGNRIPPSMFDVPGKKILDLYPAPNQNLGTRLPGNNYYVLTSGQQSNDQGDIRIDHRLTDKDSLFGSLSMSEEHKLRTTPLPGALDGVGFDGAQEDNLGRNAMLSWTRVWNPTILTETRLAFTRLVTARTQANADKDAYAEFGIGGYHPISGFYLNGGLPAISITGYSAIGPQEWLPTQEYSNVWNFIQNVAVNKGKQALKFGFEFRPIQFPFWQFPSPHGRVWFDRDRNFHPDPRYQGSTGDGIAALLLGYTQQAQITTTNFISSEKKTFAFYGQTDWKVTPTLTLNLGVRYELFSPVSEKFGRQSNFDWDRQTLVLPKGKDQDTPVPSNFNTLFPAVKVERGQVSKYLIPWDKTCVAPRIGLAWSVQPRTVVRAGYGIFYGGEENEGGNPNRGEGVPFNIIANLTMPPDKTVFDINPLFPRLSQGFPLDVFKLPGRLQLRGLTTRLRMPLVHKWNVAIQRELGHNMAWEITYIGNHQAHQWAQWDPNTTYPRPDLPAGSVPTDSLRPVPALGGVNYLWSFGYGNYAGLATKLEKRFSEGLDFKIAYTWGHALSNVGTPLYGPSGTYGTRGNPRDLSQQYSSAAWDIRHNFTTGLVYYLPLGRGRKFGSQMSRTADILLGNWQVNAMLGFRTGPPFGLGTRYGVGYIGTIHPDIVSGKDPKDPPPGGRTPAQWFDTSAVDRPAPYTPGTLGNQSNSRPGARNVDLSLFKDFRVTERYRLQFRAEAYNLTNTPKFAMPGATHGDANFGRVDTTAAPERRCQFALRFVF